MPKDMATSINYAELARVGLDLWQRIGGAPEKDKSMAAIQRSLKVYVECVKAAAGEDFDVTTII